MAKDTGNKVKDYIDRCLSLGYGGDLKISVYLLKSCFSDKGFIDPPNTSEGSITYDSLRKHFDIGEDKFQVIWRRLYKKGIVAIWLKENTKATDCPVIPNLYNWDEIPSDVRAFVKKVDDGSKIMDVKIVNKPYEEMGPGDMVWKYFELNGLKQVNKTDLIVNVNKIKKMSPAIKPERFFLAVKIQRKLDPLQIYAVGWYSLANIERLCGMEKTVLKNDTNESKKIQSFTGPTEMIKGKVYKTIDGEKVELTKEELNSLKYKET